MKQYDVICIGEVIVDMISQEPGKSLSDVEHFSKFFGGAPANVAVGLAKLGEKTAFAGRVGDDSFGQFLQQYLEKHSVNTDYITADNDHKTRLAFVSIDKRGERSFEFREKYPADLELRVDDIPLAFLEQAQVVHFGSLALTDPKCYIELTKIADAVSTSDTLISFDPNYRPSLWQSASEAYRILKAFASKAQVLKLDIEEAKFLSDYNDIDSILKTLTFDTTQLIAITLGKDGCILKNREHCVEVPGFAIDAIDSTGCGDAFMAAIGSRANAAGAITVARYGAASGLPTRSEIDRFIKTATF